MGFPGGGSGQVSFNTNGSCPQASTVGKCTFTWTWKVTQVNGQSVTPFSIGTSSHTYYKVLDTPQAPMTTPWVEVLDYSCVWAQNETTVVGAASDVAAGIYNMNDHSGNMLWTASQQYTKDDGFYEFYLEKFLNDIQSEDNVRVNCTDCANLFCIFSNVIGCNSQTRQGVGDIWTYPVQAVGELTYISKHLGSHHFGYINNYVYDACFLIWDVGGDTSVEPYNMYINTYLNWLTYTGSLTLQTPVTTTIAY